MDKLAKIKIEIKTLVLMTLALLLLVWAYMYYTAFYVVIRFNELGPLTKNMTAYYNGFKIGKITNIGPDSDFKHTLVKVNFTSKEVNLPRNTTVYVERFPNGELYLQFIYPQSPSLATLKSGDILEGIAPYSLEQFMLGQNISGVTDVVSLHVIQALQATEIANQEMKAFFENTSKMITENRKGIKASVDNTKAMTQSLAQTAENLNQASRKINNALNESVLKESTLNFKDSTSNIKETTASISKATKDIGKTMQKVDEAVSQVNATAENLNAMTSGLHQTLSKRFGGMRIMFGKPIQSNTGVENACN